MADKEGNKAVVTPAGPGCTSMSAASEAVVEAAAAVVEATAAAPPPLALGVEATAASPPAPGEAAAGPKPLASETESAASPAVSASALGGASAGADAAGVDSAAAVAGAESAAAPPPPGAGAAGDVNATVQLQVQQQQAFLQQLTPQHRYQLAVQQQQYYYQQQCVHLQVSGAVSKRRRRVSCAISASSHVCAQHLSPGPQHACMLNSFHLSLTDAAGKTGANNPGCCPDTAAAAGRHYHGRAGITATRTRTGCLSRTRFIFSCKIKIVIARANETWSTRGAGGIGRHSSRWNRGSTCTSVRWRPCSSTITSSCNNNSRSVYLCACLCVCLYVSFCMCMFACMRTCAHLPWGFPIGVLCADR